MLKDLQEQITKAGQQLGLDETQLKNLFKNDAEHVFEISLNSGNKYKAYRVQHSNKNGPYKGGIRFHEKLDFDEVRALAMLMSLKTAALGLPLGGGKGGVAINPRNFSQKEMEELSRKYVASLHPHIGPDKDVPAPDVNTNSTVMDWMVDEYEKLTNDTSKASFTGKSVARGGIEGRSKATGRGGVIVLQQLLELLKEPDTNLTFAIQGFGNVGIHFAETAKYEHPSWQFIGAADSSVGLYSDRGLNLHELAEFKQKGGRFSDYKKDHVSVVKPEEFVALDVDVLVLAALEDAVNAGNMKTIKAKYVVEMANGPVSSEAHSYLTKQGTIILPDIIANAGGVVVSYLEWLQNKKGTHLTEEEVNKDLKKYMEEAVKQTYKESKNKKLSLKEAALRVALKNLV